MVTLHSKLFRSVKMALVVGVLLLPSVPATAWSYGGHHYGGYGGHHYGGYRGHHYGGYRSHHYGGYRSHHYGGYYPYYGSSYRSYRSYRGNSYSNPDYTVSNSNEYSSADASSNTVDSDNSHGWSLLAGGEQRSAPTTSAIFTEVNNGHPAQ